VFSFFEGEEIFTDALTRYFTDFEPQSCFVDEKEGVVIGYVIGAKDVAHMGRVFGQEIGFKLLGKAILSGVFFRPKNIAFLWYCLRSMVKGEFRQPEVSQEYPATLHINIRAGFRKLGIGLQLLSAYLAYLKNAGVKAVHLATMTEDGEHFFKKLGFTELFRLRRSYFRHLLKRDFFVYVYGKKLA
jgi:GNAT superfamily N-acetyltransferase